MQCRHSYDLVKDTFTSIIDTLKYREATTTQFEILVEVRVSDNILAFLAVPSDL